MTKRYLTRDSNPELLDSYRRRSRDHWSGPDGCHEDCPACNEERMFNEDAAWRLDLGEQCNRLLDHADTLEKFERVLHREQVIKDIRSLVERVAKFEELEVEP